MANVSRHLSERMPSERAAPVKKMEWKSAPMASDPLKQKGQGSRSGST
jgi:hypothetical protein